MINDDNDSRTLSNSDSIIIPVTTDNSKLEWDVDNLQIAHSVKLDADGRGPDGCAYNEFMDRLSSDWEGTDEGPH